ncbi:uncharacterized protein LOC133876964 [Alnus glutinosa]|uniref:uncharacterized protein LOC133876964 n=1 Tax=Alnus glutinosa TaxID=3517 RepID=UPI002D77680A|nr:uncharacterized protein LOC133876964 [Alnus glutinosa]
MPLGSIELQVTVGSPPAQKMILVKFLIVDQPLAYNAIFGRTAQAELKVVTSIPHLSMKFPTENGVGVVRGEQKAARKWSPTGDLEDVVIGPQNRKLRVSAQLPTTEKKKLVEYLWDHIDVFAWEHNEMPGIDPSVIEHQLNVDRNCRPVKQRKRTFAPERNQAIADKVRKLLKAGFIREVDYPE